ncbi:hypothetical protein LRL17_33145 (plasmid) [Rhodococcus qingshengii]|uniref:hypothetical protein n=1 Tax=Rhodococcus qingshengii TaxID=334542 RepID=UPI001E2DA3CB|nr:hypothetical protein [Rhodococcus qingshengii]UGQ55731.1 hypothetical protein LRL17_33145 [Rhodococcus qingshengii]
MKEKLQEVTSCVEVVEAAFASTSASTNRSSEKDSLQRGRCARCAKADTPIEPARSAISRTFTAFDSWKAPTEKGLCAPCRWAYQTPELRTRMHLITTAPAMTELTQPRLARTLSAPLTSEIALVVPLRRPARKHILPHARWGGVAVEDTCLPWSDRDVAAAAAMRRLRSHGFGERMLGESAAPYAVLRTVPARRWPAIFEDWDHLSAYRHVDRWWALALLATKPPRSKAHA